MLKSRFPTIAAELEPLTHGALEAGAELVAQSAQSRAPIGEHEHHLRDAIRTRSEPEGVYVIAGDYMAFYGRLVEFGTAKTAAQPFLVPALEENKKAILGLVVAALKQAG